MNRSKTSDTAANALLDAFETPHRGPGAQDFPELVMLRASSDAMSPTVLEGHPVLVQVGARPEIDGGGVYVFRFPSGRGLQIRRVCITSDLRVQLMADNSRYSTETMSMAELGAIPCLGRVQFPGADPLAIRSMSQVRAQEEGTAYAQCAFMNVQNAPSGHVRGSRATHMAASASQAL